MMIGPMRVRRAFFVILICASASLASADTSYTVKRGDTLYRIARQFGISVPALSAANGLKEGQALLEGKKLVIPGIASASPPPSGSPAPTPMPSAGLPPSPSASPKPVGDYLIRSGDTLYSIARAHGMEMDELLDLNKLSKNAVIKVGKKLSVYLPGGQPSPSPKASAPAATDAPSGAPGKKPGSELAWPIPGRIEYLDGKLYGVSITGRKGEPIRAIANGTVIQANAYRGYSWVVFVERADKMIYVYGGNDSILVKKGDKVQAGMKLGYLGLNPKSGEPSMSFMVFQNGKALDPSLCPRD